MTRVGKGPSQLDCHEHMNRDWKSWLNCLLFDDTKLRKEEEPGSGRSKISKVDASSGRVM